MRKLLKRIVSLFLAVSVAAVSGAVPPAPVWATGLTEAAGEGMRTVELGVVPGEEALDVELEEKTGPETEADELAETHIEATSNDAGNEEAAEAVPNAGYQIADEAYSDTGFYIATYDSEAAKEADTEGDHSAEGYESDDEILTPDAASSVPYTDDETEILNRMLAMQAEYPEGRRWTNSDKYVWSNIYHASGSDRPYSSYTGGGCVAFAMILSDAAFGDLPAYEYKKVIYDKLRTGDILRINNNTHSVIILKKYNDSVVIAEGNYNSSIHWGRTLSKKTVESADYYVTRYAESCECRFETNGGSKVSPVRVAKSRHLSAPADPVKDRYVFAGWYKDQGLTKPWNFKKDTVDQDITLYAAWKVDDGRTLKRISLDKENTVLPLGSTVVLNATVTPGESKPVITWEADNGCIRISKSSDGRSATITPVSKGIAIVTVTAVEKFDSVEITKSTTAKIIVKRPGNSLNATMIAGEQADVSKAFFDGECPAADFEYSVAPKGYAGVSKKGVLSVKKAGSVTVTVKDKYDKEVYGSVTVNILPKPVIKFAKPLTYAGQEFTVYDAIGNLPKDSGYKFMGFTSAKENIATINAGGVITAKAPGNTTISAFISKKGENGAMKTCSVKAKLSVRFPKFAKSSYTIVTGQKLAITLGKVGETSGVTFASEDTGRLTAEAHKNKKGLTTGKVIVTGLKASADNKPVRIIATVDGKAYPCDIYIKAPVIAKETAKVRVGKTTSVSLKNTKFNKNDIEWKSENESIARVGPGGRVTGVGAGEVIVYTTTGGVRNECRITVTK